TAGVRAGSRLAGSFRPGASTPGRISRSSWAWICRASGTGLLRSTGMFMVRPNHFGQTNDVVNGQLAWSAPSNPKPYNTGARHVHPRRTRFMGQMKEFAEVYYREGALDPKTMHLVPLAAMAAAGCTS